MFIERQKGNKGYSKQCESRVVRDVCVVQGNWCISRYAFVEGGVRCKRIFVVSQVSSW